MGFHLVGTGSGHPGSGAAPTFCFLLLLTFIEHVADANLVFSKLQFASSASLT